VIPIAAEPDDLARVVTQADLGGTKERGIGIRVACTSPDGRPFHGGGRLFALAAEQLPPEANFKTRREGGNWFHAHNSGDAVWGERIHDGPATDARKSDCELPTGQFAIRAVIHDAGEKRQSVETIVTVLRRNEMSFSRRRSLFRRGLLHLGRIRQDVVPRVGLAFLRWPRADRIRSGVDKWFRRLWTTPGRNQEVLDFPIDDSMRGGILVSVLQVHDGAVGYYSQIVEVPWVDHVLHLRWSASRRDSRRERRKTWSLVVTRPRWHPDGPVEAVATLYDASLCGPLGFRMVPQLQFLLPPA
jgi:hypothetical protein